MIERFISIDEEGFVLSNETRTSDPVFAGEILAHIEVTSKAATISKSGGMDIYVEAFDAPYVAHSVFCENKKWFITIPYEMKFEFDLHSLKLDEWDRFHGLTLTKVPFVMLPKAQDQFFDLLESFDDESISFDGEQIEIPPYWPDRIDIENEEFWTNVYHQDVKPGWDLGQPAEALKDMLPRLKLVKSKILVLGCGEGHDAALFAQSGHHVTAVDISPEAIARAQKHYGKFQNIKWITADIFKLPNDFHGQFDIVFEHTCFCAINPTRRKELIKIWRQLLNPQGFVMGVFFTMEKPNGPPYGVTEWEIRQYLKSHFQFVFWGRWRKSLPQRQGRELFVYAQKKSLL